METSRRWLLAHNHFPVRRHSLLTTVEGVTEKYSPTVYAKGMARALELGKSRRR